MGEEEKKQPEGQETETPLQKSKRAVMENLLAKRDEMIGELKKNFQERISGGSEKLDQRAYAKMIQIQNEQINQVAKFFNDKIKEYEKLSESSAADADKIAENLMARATEKAQSRIMKLRTILDTKIKDKHVTTAEVADIVAAIAAIEEFEKNNSDLEPLFEKMANKEELTKEDYERIVKLIQPLDITSGQPGAGAFEASASGLLISMMRPDQRFELVRVFMDSDKKNDAITFMDALLRTGRLSKMQGQELLEAAKSKGINVPSGYEEDFNKADYEKIAGEYRQTMEQVSRSKYGGMYAENVMNKFSGKPFFYMLAFAWGTVTMGLNILVNRKKGDKITTVLEKLSRNPYVYASGAAMLGGYEGMYGALKTSGVKSGDLLTDMGMGAGPLSRKLESWSEKGDEEILHERARAEMERLYSNAPVEFRLYLENGGFSAMQEVRKEIFAKNLQRKMSIGQILEKEKDPDQIRRLEEMTKLYPGSEKYLGERFTAFSEAAFALGIKTNDDLQPELKSFKSHQKPEEQTA